MTTQLPIVILISGSGSNLQSIIDACKDGLAVDIRAVISNNADAFGLERAQKAGIPAHCISHRDYKTRDEFDIDLIRQIDVYKPQLIVLAGFMRRLGAEFVAHYKNKIINIHPSLLPKYPGLHTHRKVLTNKDQQHGASIHIVTTDLDAGPLLCQASLDVEELDTEDTLKERVQKIEHKIYPAVLQWFAENRITFANNAILMDGKPLPKSGINPLIKN